MGIKGRPRGLMTNNIKATSQYDPWARLAAAIIRSGRQCYDKSFLDSEWCDDLMEMCRLDDELHPGHSLYTSYVPKRGAHSD